MYIGKQTHTQRNTQTNTQGEYETTSVVHFPAVISVMQEVRAGTIPVVPKHNCLPVNIYSGSVFILEAITLMDQSLKQ